MLSVCRVYFFVSNVLYTVSLGPFPSPSCPFSLAVGDSGAAAQLDNHLLAVMEGPLVSQFLQGASSIREHAHPLAGSRQEGGGKVAARQHHSLRLLTLAWPHLALLCRQITQKFIVALKCGIVIHAQCHQP